MYEYTDLTINDFYFILRCMWMTVRVTVVSITLGTFLGFILGLIRAINIPIINKLPLLIIEPLRNTPLLVQLFLTYYGLAMVSSYSPGKWEAAIVVLSLNTSAFIAVIIHASIKAISPGQWEAAYALGHSFSGTFIYVIFKQAFRIFIPSAFTIYVSQLQVSSLVALIQLEELTRAGEILTNRTFKPFLVWSIIMGCYFILAFPLSKLARYMEGRLSKEMNIDPLY